MADILSQDEIDRLLQASSVDSAPEVSDLDPADVEEAEKLIRVFFASANSALATLLARPASVSEGLGQVVSVADLDSARALAVHFPFRSGLTGRMTFLLPYQEAGQLADLILGGEGTAKDELDESDLDAIQEAMTQVAGSGAPNLSAKVGMEVAFGTPAVEVVEQGSLETALGISQAFLGAGTIRVEDALESPLRILLTVELAEELARRTEAEEVGPAAVVGTPGPTPVSAAFAPESPARRAVASEPPADIRNIDLIMDIEVEVMVRLGEAEMSLRAIQQLRPGSIIDLDKDTDAPVELVVNDKVIARGELVVVGSDHFALRITEIETPTERIRTLGP